MGLTERGSPVVRAHEQPNAADSHDPPCARSIPWDRVECPGLQHGRAQVQDANGLVATAVRGEPLGLGHQLLGLAMDLHGHLYALRNSSRRVANPATPTIPGIGCPGFLTWASFLTRRALNIASSSPAMPAISRR